MARDGEETGRLGRPSASSPATKPTWSSRSPGAEWLVFDGRINLPDGEIYTAPVNSSLNGAIHFDYPGVFGGRLIPDIRLEWRDGALINASASSNEDYLLRILETDAGSSRLGEFAFGIEPAYESLLRRHSIR